MIKKTSLDHKVRFKTEPSKDAFIVELRTRIDNYFAENNISPKGNTEFWIKVVLAIVFWFGTYSFIISDVLSDNYWLLFGAYSLLGFANIFIAFSFVHDAVHDACSNKPWVNQVLGRGMDFVGGNSYLLRQMHNEHHKWVNIHGIDVTLETHGMFRFTPHEEWKWFHKYQHFYVPLIYCFAQIHWVLFKDFKWFFGESHIGNIKNVKHPIHETFILLGFKALYYTLTLVLPIIFLSVPWWIAVLGFISAHVLSGLTFALIFQCTHICSGTHYPMPDKDGNIENNYAIHVLETTADFSRKSRIGSYLMGGINIHVIHHIFPHINHVHYQKVTPILIQCAEEYGIKYNEFKTFPQALRAHMSMLKLLGQKDAKLPEYAEQNIPKFHKVGA